MNEILNKLRDILAPLAQRRDAQGNGIQAIIKIRAKSLLLQGLFDVDIRCGDDADVDSEQPAAAQPGKLLVLEYVEKLGLEPGGHFSDFIEKDGAVVAKLEQSWLGLDGSRECPRLVSEEFALEQIRREGSAVDFEKRARRPRRMRVELPRYEFLARAGFAEEKNGHVDPCDHFDLAMQLNHRGTERSG